MTKSPVNVWMVVDTDITIMEITVASVPNIAPDVRTVTSVRDALLDTTELTARVPAQRAVRKDCVIKSVGFVLKDA